MEEGNKLKEQLKIVNYKCIYKQIIDWIKCIEKKGNYFCIQIERTWLDWLS
jgi:hypothetical protein